MPEAAEEQKTNVIDISKFFGGKTLSSADLKVGTQTIKAEPSFIAAPELAKLLEVISTYTEVNKTQSEEIKSIERIREREITEKTSTDNRFYQALSSLKFDVETLKNSFSTIVQTLQSDKKLREQELQDERNKQKVFESEAKEAQKGLQFQETTAYASTSFTGQQVQSEEQSQQTDQLNLAGLLGLGAAGGLIGGGPDAGSVPGGDFDAEKLTSLARSVGMPEDKIPQMVAIALAESGGGSNEHFTPEESGGTDDSYGLWQINMLGEMGNRRLKEYGLKKKEELFDPVTNAKAAKKVLESQGFGAWATYGGDRYKQYLPKAQEASKKLQSSTKPAASTTSPQPAQISSAGTQNDGERPAPQIAAVTTPASTAGQISAQPISNQSPVIITTTPQRSVSPTKGQNVSPSEDIALFGSINSEDINVLSSMYQLNLA